MAKRASWPEEVSKRMPKGMDPGTGCHWILREALAQVKTLG